MSAGSKSPECFGNGIEWNRGRPLVFAGRRDRSLLLASSTQASRFGLRRFRKKPLTPP